jgi:hypothetical protein
VEELQGQNLFHIFNLLLKISVSLHTKFTVGARLSEGQYLRGTQNRVMFLTLRDGTLTLILSVKKRKKFVLTKACMKKGALYWSSSL